MTSVSCGGLMRAAARRSRTSRRQSRMARSRDASDRRDEFLPALSLRVECPQPFSRDSVKTTPALARFLHPAPNDPAATFHAVQQGVERRHVKRQHTLRSRLDQLAELVTV